MSGLVERAEAYLQQCGACDAGLPMDCTCPDGDPCNVIADLVAECSRLAGELAEARARIAAVEDALRTREAEVASALPGALVAAAMRGAGVKIGTNEVRAALTAPVLSRPDQSEGAS